jgi:hypothetical protein
MDAPEKVTPPNPAPAASLPSASDILKEALEVYKRNLATLFGVTALSILMMAAVIAIFGIGGPMLGMGLIFFNKAAGGIGASALLFFVFFTVALSFIQVWMQASLIYTVKDDQELLNIKEAYIRGASKIVSYWWISFLLGIAVAIGGIFFIIPGIIFAVWFSMAMYVLIAEGLKGTKALSKSREYVKGHWWGVLWRVIFIGVAISLGYAIIGLIFGVFGGHFTSYIILFILGVFVEPLVIAYMFRLYTHLKELKG